MEAPKDPYPLKKGVDLPAPPETPNDSNEGRAKNYDMHRTYASAFLSGIFFIVASVLYIVLAVGDLQYYNEAENYTDDELDADDAVFWDNFHWEADWLFGEDYWVSRYMVVYFLAALSFVVVGVIDWVYKPGFILGITFVLAGLCGVVASTLYDYDERLSNIFDLISVHLFFVEAIELLYYSIKRPGAWDLISLAGDGMFLTGSFIDVVLSYPALFETFDWIHSIMGILASTLWLGAALVNMYGVITVRELYGRKEHIKDAPSNDSTGDGDDSHTMQEGAVPAYGSEHPSSSEESFDKLESMSVGESYTSEDLNDNEYVRVEI